MEIEGKALDIEVEEAAVNQWVLEAAEEYEADQEESNAALYRWVFTCFRDADHAGCIDWLKANVKAYDFQYEKCPTTGSLHYQGRVALKQRLRKGGVIALFRGGPLAKSKLASERDPAGGSKSKKYCHKVETRVDGPWSSDDIPIFIPRQYDLAELWPSQQVIRDSLTVRDDRGINVCINKSGNCGKSSFLGFAVCRRLAGYLPVFHQMKDYAQAVCDMPTFEAYMCDMPRNLNKEKLGEFWAAMEMIKGGIVYDPRYHYKMKFMNSPVLWIFTNEYPPIDALSYDRWRWWKLSEDGKEIVSIPVVNPDQFHGAKSKKKGEK